MSADTLLAWPWCWSARVANGRGGAGRKKRDTGRDAGAFVALPLSVLDGAAFRGLSHTARSLLLEVARQFRSDDNGRMLLTGKYMATRGWHSPDVLQRAKRELLDAELIFETVKGCRPNRASWYAVTWRKLDRLPGYDPGVERAFEQGAYRRLDSVVDTSKPRPKNASLTTSPVVGTPSIATSHVVGGPPTTTADVAMEPISGGPPTTSHVVPLDMPSEGVRIGPAGVAPDLCVEGASSNRVGNPAFDLLVQLQRRVVAEQATAHQPTSTEE